MASASPTRCRGPSVASPLPTSGRPGIKAQYDGPMSTAESSRNDPQESPGEGAGGALQAQLVAPEALGEYEDGWRERSVERGELFLTPDWFKVWIRHYGAGAKPNLVVATDAEGTLVGIAPFVRHGRALRFAGSGLGDHFSALSHVGRESAVAAAVAPLTAEAAYVVLDRVDRNAEWVEALTEARGKGMTSVRSHVDVLPAIQLEDTSWDEYLASRSRNFRSQVRRRLRAIEREPSGHFRRTERADELQADLDRFFQLHDVRWEGRGGSSIATERSRAFLRDLAGALLERGWLRLWFLELENETLAAWYGWKIGGRYGYYSAGLHPRGEAVSAGFALLSHTIRSAIEEGAQEYALLRGDEPYKARFETRRTEIETVVVAPAASGARVLASAEALAWDASRRLSPEARRRGSQVYRAARRLMPMSIER